MKTIKTWLKRAAMLSVTVAFAAVGFRANAATSLTLNDGDTLTGVYEDYEITIAAGATVTFNGASVTLTSGGPAVRCAGDATIILADGSVNSVDASATSCAGIFNYAGGDSGTTNTLTIAGTGALTVLGGNRSAGIGANQYNNSGSAGNIIISGGTVTATGGEWAAGIGTGYYGTCRNITITGGTVTANVDITTSDTGTGTAAIGAGCRGECGNILISGGIVVADAHNPQSEAYDNCCAIGATYVNGKCGDITITEGITSVTVTKGATAQQHIGQGDGQATVGKVPSLLRFNKEYSNNGNTLTLTPGSDFESFTVTWKNDDGTTIGTTTVEYGLMPEHANATKASDSDFDHVFTGWAPELAEVESNTTYTAVFCPVPLVRSTGGNAEWFFEADGSLRSGAIGNSENTWFRASLPRPCVFTFEWKTSSENGCDWLGFTVNGEDAYDTAGNIIGRISGEKDNWATVSVVVSNSLDVLEWKYWKDGSAARGQDCGWIRNFSMAPYEGEVRTLSVVPNYDGEATVNAYAAKDCALGVFPVVARHGYAFLGLFTAAEGGELVEPPYALSADTTLYAHWAKTTDFDTSDPTAEWTIEDDGITWRTGAIGHRTNTWATYTVKRPCTVTYKWKTSTEANNDPLVFYVDDVEQSRISGEMTDWADISLTFEDSANHVLKWVYSKDTSSSGTYDCGWISDFVVTPLDSWAVTRNLNYEGAGELETRYVKKGNQLDVSEFPPLDEPCEGYTCYWALAPWSGDALTEPVDISADTTLYAHWIKQYGFDEIDTTCQEPWTWLEDGSIRTGKIGDSTNTWATISVTGPCDVSFKWKSSSEGGWDKLHFYVDADHKTDISGVQDDWTTYSVSVGSGDHVLKWSYTKDGSKAIGEDCGWIKDIVITAPDSAPYTVTWKNADGTTLETDADLEAGAVPVYNSALPTQAATAQYYYDFAGWDPELELVSSNTTYTAKYTATLRSYNVTWQDEGGAELATETLCYGTTPEYAGETPTKPATPKYTYTFAGWDPEVAEVTGEATYTAKYDATINKYTITWKNDDGTVIDSEDVAYDETPTHADPTKASTAQYHYEFAGWDPEVASVTGEAAYTATFTPILRSYTITWLNENGSQIDTTTVAYGATPTHAAPTKASTAQYDYTFAGWGEVVAVTGEATYQATFTPVLRSYTITWANIDGAGAVATSTVAYGSIPAYGGVTPTKAETAEYTYSFTGWSHAIAAVTGAATYTAQFSQTKRSYTITWANIDGAGAVATSTAEYGQTPTYGGETPTKESTAEYSYEFSGWSPALSVVTGDATYTAQFNATKRSYMITWANIDGEGAVATSTAEYGQTPTYGGATPTKAETAEYTYTFSGWSPAVVSVTGAATYTATFNATPKDESGTVDVSTLANGAVVQNGSVLTGTAPNLNLKVAAGATITLDGVCITNSAGDVSVLHCLGDATIILAPDSENTVVGTVGNYCTGNAIYVPTNSTLTITGSGSLYADSSSSEFRSAAIGAFAYPYNADYIFPCGNIVIEGGTITAKGGVGIGASGNGGYCGDITITGDANVTAIATVNGSAGIGAAGTNGNCGDITISGNASVTATGKYNGPGIGAADHSTCGDIVIATTGSVTATGHYFAPGIGACGAYEECKCGNITIADTITEVVAQGQNDALGIYTTSPSEFTYGSHLELVTSDGNRCYTLTPVSGDPEGVVDLSTLTGNYTAQDGDVLTGATGYAITIAAGATVTLDGVTITHTSGSERAVIDCAGNATIVLAAGSENFVTNTVNNCAAIHPANNATLTIRGSGALDAYSSGDYGAGIGAASASSNSNPYPCGNIVIEGGTITAHGGYDGAGIGAASRSAPCGNIVISGGNITAVGGYCGAGIGACSYDAACGNITITSDAVVHATGGAYAAGIGAASDRSPCGNITISGNASVTATSTTYSNANAAGIGAGYDSACGSIIISTTGTVKALGVQAAGIGAGGRVGATCAGITITSGIITATGGSDACAIGASFNADCGDILIEGGTITAAGGEDCPGVGARGETASITITGGNVTAIGGSNGSRGNGGAGIGSMYQRTCGNIAISGGTVNATGGAWAAGIGSGYYGTCSNITISAGIVTANVCTSTSDGETDTVAIGAGCRGTCGNILISGGTVVANATNPQNASKDFNSAIGATYRSGKCGDITITDGITSVTATKGATAQQHIGQGDGYATIGTVTISPRLAQSLSNNDLTLTLTPLDVPDTVNVTWKNEDGTTLETDTVAYGATPTYDGETPTKAADAQYTYTFGGWLPTVVAATSNTTYTATFSSALNEYVISWDTDGNGEVDDTTTVAYGTVPTHADGSKAATAQYTYTFTGWDTAPVAVTGPATYTAQFRATVNEYTISWDTDGNGEVDDTTTVAYGTVPTHVDGSKAATAQYTYTFTGWDTTPVAVTGPATYTATFSETVNEYAISWVIEGVTVASGAVEYGTTPAYGGETPTKESTAEYTYEFTGWSPTVATVTGAATYTAQFNSTKRSYMVSWVVEGVTVASGSVEYGTTPAYGGATPTKESTAEYSYEFTGWSPTVAAVTGAATYTAQFEATKRSYTVSWVVEGVTVASGTVEYGQTPTYSGETPTKEATAEYTYTFSGWSPEVSAVTGAATYTAQFEATKRSYTVAWVVEGVMVASGTVEYGTVPSYSGATPTKAEDEDYTYAFTGWSPAVVAVTGNATYTATFSETPKEEPEEPGEFRILVDEYDPTTVTGFEGTCPATITAADWPEGVECIDENAFNGCTNLQHLTFPAGIKKIGRYSFRNCDALETVDFSNCFDTLKSIGMDSFNGCTSLRSLDIDGDSLVISFGAFYACTSLTSLRLGSGVSQVYEYAFGASRALAEVTIVSPETLVGGAAFIGTAYYKNMPFAFIVKEDWEGTRFVAGFKGVCPENIAASDWPEGVEYIDVRTFPFTDELRSVEFPASFTGIYSGSFACCTNLESITFPVNNSASGRHLFVGDNAFAICTKLRSVTLRGALTISDDAFAGCTRLETVVVEEGVNFWGERLFARTGVRSIVLPENVENVSAGAFAGNDGDFTVHVPRSVVDNYGLEEGIVECDSYIPNVPGFETEARWAEYGFTYQETTTNLRVVPYGDEPEKPELPFTTDGDAKWTVDVDGSWRSGAIGNSQSTWAETNVVGSCLVSFKWKVSSEESFDKLKLLVDDDEKMTISGTKDWKEVILPLSDSGEHTIRWSYAKDSSESRGDDCGWVKDFQVMELVTVPIRTGGDAEWFVDPNGNWRSGVIDAYQTTWAETTVTGPCRVNFRWKTSSEEDYNRLTLIVDGTERDAISGVMGDWEAKTLKFQDSRNHVIRWSYSKNTYAYESEDCGWVKGFTVETLPIEDFTFTVEWLDWDGYELETDEDVAYGATPVYNSELPVRPDDYRYSYSFVGWTPTLTSVTEDATYTAVYFARRLGEETETIDGIEWSYIVDGDEARITKASPVTGCLTIPASVSDGITVTAIDDDAFNDCDNLTSVVIPEGVERIGERAFYGCAKLESVEFPATVESIGWMAFAYCRKLATVTFNGNIDDIDFDSGVNYTFEGTPWAANIPFKLEMDGTCVVGYSGRMNGKISFADWPAEATSIAEWAFGWEYGLLDVEIPATIVEIGNNAFNGCENITNLVFEAEGEAPLAIGEWAFGNLLKLETVVLPARLASLASGSFGQDEKLADVQFLGEGADVAKDAFVRTPYLLTLDFWMFVDEDGIAYFVQGTPPDDMSASDWPTGLSGIADNLFFCNTNLASVVIPKSVTNVAYQAFYGCTALTNVVFEAVGAGEDVLPLAIMDSAFYECANLASVTFREGISSIKDGAFYGCTALATVNFPGGSEDGVDIGNFAFARTAYDAGKDFEFIVLSHSVTGFHGTCPAIIRAEDWPDGVVAIASSAFSECSTLEQVTLPTGITDIYWQAFHGCENLGSVNFANSFDTLKTIDREAFSGCTSLETVELDGKDLMIDEGAFEGCTGLTALTIREGVSSIQDFAFSNCRKLEAFVNNSYADIAETAFIGTEYYRNMDFKFIKRLCWEGGWEIVGHKGECPAQINAADWPEDTTVIYRGSFTFDDDLRAVEFPASLRRIDESAFACCTNLVSLTFPEDGSLAIDHNAFALCTKLQNITLRGDLMVCPDAFAGCSSLETVRIEEGVYELDEGAFARTQVSSIVLPEGMDEVSAHAFAYDDGDFTVYVPRSETSMYGLSNGDVTYEYMPRIFGLETEEGWARYGLVVRATTTNLRVVPYCRVTLDLAGGTGVATSQLGTGETVNDQFPHPVKAGFAFAGWTSARVAEITNDTTWTAIIGSATGMEATLTALWTPNETPEPPEIVVEDQELKDKLDDPVVDEDTGIRTIKPKDDQTTLTQEDADKIEIVSPLDGVTRITGAYVRTCSWQINEIVISLATPEVEPVVVEENKDEEDATGLLEDVDKVDDGKIAAMPEPDVSDPDPEKREEVGALPVKMYPGLYYQASWGDNLNNLTPGAKFRADGSQTHIGVIKQTGSRGFYRISVSER